MDDSAFKERVKKLEEINAVITKLDPAIREASFKLLESYVTGKASMHNKDKGQTGGEVIEHEDMESFFSQFDHDKPSDNAFSIAAYHYSCYGKTEFSVSDIKTIADEVGITIPERVDVTYKGAKKGGKNLFQAAGRGKYKPTVNGETYFKQKYSVKKGTKKKEEDS